MKVVIFGLGSIARKHIAAIRSLDPEAEIFALRSRRDAPSVADVKNLYDLDEARRVFPDFVIISTPTSEHFHSVEQALSLRCPLFIEKPLCHDEGVFALAEMVEKAGVLNYVGCNLRFLPCLQFVREALKRNSLRVNEVNVYCGSYLPDWRPGTDYRRIYSSRPEMGGGAHLDLIHEIDYVYWLFGMPGEVSKTLRSRSSLGIEAIDYANYCLCYNDFCASVILNYFRRDYRRTLEIVADQETWLVDLAADRITSGERMIFESDEKIGDTYRAQMAYFIGLVKSGKKESCNSVSDACNTMRIAL